MGKLTEKQQRFVDAVAAGVPQRQAALNAGYAPVSAKVTASQMMQRADIKAAIKAAKKSQGVSTSKNNEQSEDDRTQWLKDRYDSPLDLHTDVMNNPAIPFAIRMAAAKEIMPYCHARVESKGKKETKKDRAAEIACGDSPATATNVTAFRTRQAPRQAKVN